MPPKQTIETHKYAACQHNCQNSEHYRQIRHAIESTVDNPELGANQQQHLAAYIAKTCRNFANNHGDSTGRSTALHLIANLPATVDLSDLVEFLINHRADVNAVDAICKRTPLHFACSNGNVRLSALLVQRGATTNALDAYDKLALNYWDDWVPSTSSVGSDRILETWVWGQTANYNVGLVHMNSAGHSDRPQPLEMCNRYGKSTIQELAISPNHCMYVDHNDELYVMGNGKGGILGIDEDVTILAPRLVTPPLAHKDSVRLVAVSRFTSMLLTHRNHVYTCGLNAHNQLGYDTDGQSTFRRVRFAGQKITIAGIISHDKYSVAYGIDTMLAWGECYGQFGSMVKCFDGGRSDVKHIQFHREIRHVASTDWAIAVCLKSDAHETVLVMQNYQNHSVRIPEFTTVKHIAMDATSNADVIRLVVRTSDGCLIWLSDMGLLDISQPIEPLLFADRQLLFLMNGRVFRSDVMVKKMTAKELAKKNEWHRISAKDTQLQTHSCCVEFAQQIPLLDRVRRVVCDADGKTLVALQSHSYESVSTKRITEKRAVKMAQFDMGNLLAEATVDDGLADIAFVVEGRTFVAHRFILLSRAPQMRVFVDTRDARTMLGHIDDEKLTSTMFELILKHIYEGKCVHDATLPPECIPIFRKFSKRCGLLELSNHTPPKQTGNRPELAFDRLQHEDLYDVTFMCGVEKTTVRAHKCILVARSEYFRMMFSRRWSESVSVHLPNVGVDCMLFILDYLYTFMDNDIVNEMDLSDAFIAEVAIVCDQLLLHDLSLLVESVLIERITAKKCLDLLRFAIDLDQEYVRLECVRYVQMNMARMLERRLFDNIDGDMCSLIMEDLKRKLECELAGPRVDEPLELSTLMEYVGKFTVDIQSTATVVTHKSTPKTKSEHVRRMPKLPLAGTLEDSTMVMTAIAPQSEVQLEAARIADELNTECQRWSTIGTKKDSVQQKRNRANSFVYANEVLAQEPKTDGQYVKLGSYVEENDDMMYTQQFDRMSVSLNAFSPQSVGSKRLSQRERKRLSSSSSEKGATDPATAANLMASSPTENVWTARNPHDSPTNDTPSKTSSFFDAARKPSSMLSPMIAAGNGKKLNSPHKSKQMDIVQIQKDEQRTMEKINKLKNKPLWKTQAEEEAIAELKKFYNVENVHDERIVIDRVQVHSTRRDERVHLKPWYQ